MECLYYPNLDENTSDFILSNDEAKHAKALRVQTGDEILISNGKGNIAKCKFETINKYETKLSLIEFLDNSNENKIYVHAALGILDNKDRFEFALEKAVELGCHEFTPLITDYSSSKKLNINRLNSKALAAMKQSKRSFLPRINQPTEIEDLINSTVSQIIIADINGKPNISIDENVILFVGPEGGFSEKEIKLINSKNSIKMSLGFTRLRAETALIASLSKIIL
jgi:16S rRNA (uracil1498-N3)-methyltransferase